MGRTPPRPLLRSKVTFPAKINKKKRMVGVYIKDPIPCIKEPGMGSPHPPEDDWVISINHKLEDARQYDTDSPWKKINIYKVPHCLGDSQSYKAYIPQVVSLGPYHHGRMLLQPMELHKWRALKNILQRNDQNIKLYLDAMKELEGSARACYEGPLKLMSSNKFAEMMVLDGCFVLELLQGATEQDGFDKLGYAWNDPVFSVQGKILFIRREMIMLENQIPLIVLGKLFKLQCNMPGLEDAEDKVAWLAIHFFKPLMQRDESSAAIDNITELKSSTRDSTASDPQSAKVGLHCLDVFRKCLLYKGPDNVRSSTRDSTTSDPQSAKVGLRCLDVFRKCLLYKGPDNVQSSTGDSTSDPQSAKAGLHCLDVFRKCLLYKRPDNVPEKLDNHGRRQQLIHCVTDLKDAGIKFKNHETGRLCDIQFNNGVLDIPRIVIDDDTESVLFNLIAFEQCHSGYKKDIANYVAFLDNLIDSAEDISYLRSHKIIEHWLGDDGEVANLVNRLCQEVAFDITDKKFSEMSEEIMKHYDRKWNTWRATLKQKYFNNPWAILSLVAAVFLLLMTAAQTFYTVYGYYLPSK